MQKRRKGRKFGREKNQRKALLRGLVASFFLGEKIKTTEAKAKEARILIEKVITRAKKGDLHSRRQLLRYFPPKTVKKIVDGIAPKYKERKGGYTRIIKLGPRKLDAAKMAVIELVK